MRRPVVPAGPSAMAVNGIAELIAAVFVNGAVKPKLPSGVVSVNVVVVLSLSVARYCRLVETGAPFTGVR